VLVSCCLHKIAARFDVRNAMLNVSVGNYVWLLRYVGSDANTCCGCFC
jgi:hypothetical protein